MKLIRFGGQANPLPGVIIGDSYYDVSHLVRDYDEQFFSSDGLARLQRGIANGWLNEVDRQTVLCAPVARPSKIVCVGLNYPGHASEIGAEMPLEPVIFLKPTSAITGPNDELVLPRGSTKTDWEVELAVVIGKRASQVSREDAMEHVAGYMLHNDYSEREFQLERGSQWSKGKGFDGFAPMGPFLATVDEIADVGDLGLWLKVNGKLMQKGNTGEMAFGVAELISYVSRFMTLYPGDVISTGSPAGSALGQKPEPGYLRAGDVVELGIDGLGSSRQVVRAFGEVEDKL